MHREAEERTPLARLMISAKSMIRPSPVNIRHEDSVDQEIGMIGDENRGDICEARPLEKRVCAKTL